MCAGDYFASHSSGQDGYPSIFFVPGISGSQLIRVWTWISLDGAATKPLHPGSNVPVRILMLPVGVACVNQERKGDTVS